MASGVVPPKPVTPKVTATVDYSQGVMGSQPTKSVATATTTQPGANKALLQQVQKVTPKTTTSVVTPVSGKKDVPKDTTIITDPVLDPVVVPGIDPSILARLNALEAENALLKSNKEAATAAQRQSAFDMLRSYAEQYDMPATIADRLIDLVANQGYTGTAVTLELQNTPEFKERFAGIEAYKKNFASEIASGQKAAAPTPSTYIAYEKAYQEVLNRYGLADLANRDTFSKLIGGDVSPNEVTDRVANVYDRVMNADDVLKQQLNQFFPTFGTSDFARALLTGTTPQDMAGQLQRKLAAAEISSEASRAGLTTSAQRAMDLQQMGLSRSQARAGYSTIAEQQPVLQKLGEISDINTSDIQSELEQEQFTGLASQRRKKLTELEKSRFAGSSGTSRVSLGASTAGQI
jgi:hypothetical protein